MRTRTLAATVVCIALSVSSCAMNRAQTPDPANALQTLSGKSYRLEPAYLITVHVPEAEADKVLASVTAAVGLYYGKYDQVAYLDAPGLEQFRPLAGSKSGQQVAAGRAPSVIVRFSVPLDNVVLKKALDAVYTAHSYEEPVIYIREVWRTRSTNPDDSNPNRWWNDTKQ